jgi:hypothetical protein
MSFADAGSPDLTPVCCLTLALEENFNTKKKIDRRRYMHGRRKKQKQKGSQQIPKK